LEGKYYIFLVTKCRISVEDNTIMTSSEPPMIISSKQVFVDEHTMLDLFGDNYTVDQIREKNGAYTSSEEVVMAKPLFE
jgi:hypothetical protein